MQKGRPIRRRHTRTHLKVWEYFHKKPHIQLPAHSFYENNEWFLYFSLILCRFYPRGGELRLLLRSIFDFLSGARALARNWVPPAARDPRTITPLRSREPAPRRATEPDPSTYGARQSRPFHRPASSNNATILSMEHFVKTILTKIRDSRRNRSPVGRCP